MGDYLQYARELLEKYAYGQEVRTKIVEHKSLVRVLPMPVDNYSRK